MPELNESSSSNCCANFKLPIVISIGLLLLRLGLGSTFIFVHGWPKIMGGMEKWAGLGGAMSNLGITFWPTFWGFMAAFAEFGGAILLTIGLFFRPAAFLMFFTMLVATVMHMKTGDGSFGSFAYSFELGAVFLGLMFTGGGDLALGNFIPGLKKHCFK